MNTPHIFNGFGIELEYMIVHQQTLDVMPIADQVLKKVAGRIVNEVKRGRLAWSNELVMHVIELKTVGPVASIIDLHRSFQEDVREINLILEDFDACLLPSAMHPWMDPSSEAVLWPHDNNEIYDAYNRIFNCQGHGWSNLQSTHINLAFNGDSEFGKLHSAIRLILPILPAIAASSPIAEGRLSGYSDTRLHYYRQNQRRIPSIAGHIIPEAVLTREEYEQQILQRIYKDIAPHDPDKILQDEWLNSRGAIARFDRNAIEIRLLDVQECPLVDITIAYVTIEILKKIAGQTWTTLESQTQLAENELAEILHQTIVNGSNAIIDNLSYLNCFGLTNPVTAKELWLHLNKAIWAEIEQSPLELQETIDKILSGGSLSQRLTKLITPDCSHNNLFVVYKKLAENLQKGEFFDLNTLGDLGLPGKFPQTFTP